MHWPMIWWIFPLACMIVMAVMFVFMAGVGGMRCMPRKRQVDKPGLADAVRQSDELAFPSSSSHSSSKGS